MRYIFSLLLMLCAVQASAQDTARLSMIFLGDIMQHDSQIKDAYSEAEGDYDYTECFQYIKPYIKAADIAIGNLEVTLAGKPYKGYPQFSAPDELLPALLDMGLDVIVTANNHSVDRGRAGIERTIAMLDSFGVHHTGTFTSARERTEKYPLIVNKGGFKLAILNYTYGTNGIPVPKPTIVNMLDSAAMRRDLIAARSQDPDAIIVFTHWGSEYQSLPSASQKAFADLCFRYGAKLVIGAHPHVVQPMEWRREKDQLVAWSLGNFVSGQRKRYTDGGAMIRVMLEKVTRPDGGSITSIHDADYILEWVYRTEDAEQNYFVIPVPGASKKFPEASAQAFQTFVDDSRALFQRYNVNVPEMKSPASFALKFNATDTLGVKNYLLENSGLWEADQSAYPTLHIGPLTMPDAEHLMWKLRRDLPVDNIQIAEIRK